MLRPFKPWPLKSFSTESNHEQQHFGLPGWCFGGPLKESNDQFKGFDVGHAARVVRLLGFRI
jgi:hypothetical protein